MTTQTEIRKTGKQYEIDERRKKVAVMAAQNMTEVEIAAKLGVDNSTISNDIKALKLISQQFYYDITKSDFTYYYKQNLDIAKLVLRKQWEIVDKEVVTPQDLIRAKVLADILNTVDKLNGYYDSSRNLYRTPEQAVYYSESRLGLRPGSVSPMEKRAPMLTKEETIDETHESVLKTLKGCKPENYDEQELIAACKDDLEDIKENIEKVRNDKRFIGKRPYDFPIYDLGDDDDEEEE